MKTVAIGCDQKATEIKEMIKAYLEELGYGWEDFGNDHPIYANVAFGVGDAIAARKFDCGILLY